MRREFLPGCHVYQLPAVSDVTRILPSCDDGLPRYQDQELHEDALDTQDQEGADHRQNQEPAIGIIPLIQESWRAISSSGFR